jgi:hypothetical protein
MLQLFLVLHVLGAIFVFGPSITFPLIARHAGRSPQHGHFAAVVSDAIERRIVLPGAIVQGITGLCLVIILVTQQSIDLTSPSWRWLFGAVTLYLIAIAYAITIQAPAAERMVHLTAGGPPAGAPPAGAPAGPPPEIAATANRLNRGGQFLTLMIVLIVILMVTKPAV